MTETKPKTLEWVIERLHVLDSYASKLDDRIEQYHDATMSKLADKSHSINRLSEELQILANRLASVEKQLRQMTLFLSGVLAGAGFAGAAEGLKLLKWGVQDND